MNVHYRLSLRDRITCRSNLRYCRFARKGRSWTVSRVMTVGYEGQPDVMSFAKWLASEGIETLVDVRESPRSRKPGFSANDLEQILEVYGINYHSMKSLGAPKEIRDVARSFGDTERALDLYEDMLPEKDQYLDELADLVMTNRSCLLCYEENPALCHRSVLSNALAHRIGVEVEHLRHGSVGIKASAHHG